MEKVVQSKIYRLKELAPDNKPENNRIITVSRTAYGALHQEKLRIERIFILEDSQAVITPNAVSSSGMTDGTNLLAVLMHKYDIRTSPEAARDYGSSLTIMPGQIPKMLRVLVKHGLGFNIARRIAEDNNFEIPAARGIRRSRFVDALGARDANRADKIKHGRRMVLPNGNQEEPEIAAGTYDVNGNVYIDPSSIPAAPDINGNVFTAADFPPQKPDIDGNSERAIAIKLRRRDVNGNRTIR